MSNHVLTCNKFAHVNAQALRYTVIRPPLPSRLIYFANLAVYIGKKIKQIQIFTSYENQTDINVNIDLNDFKYLW